ncbi:Methyltransferase domain-containing protein [Amycolatopsis arida]|uniref:Methyltransferase domain-containing protein n=1 Tax=Amycolatopsis arida TaxID=587909 RepID=A0A1I5L527_9PSEU|nr:class I SAM-dependent methyltransferase [Amycolatopsis arida]TDX93584.1 methyltransferase family protein [Amycolatopsis arida]SFO92345.1 Methyltransferase domain-containing protein [Amycolatopsis arida]
MNWLHRKICGSARWARKVERDMLPWALDGVDLGDRVLEIGPGYGATLRPLAARAPKLTAVELDPTLAARLSAEHGDRVRVVQGDGADLPLDGARFDAVVCFTMLHHVPTPARQDALFAEALRVLRPGGTFAGADGVDRWPFRLLHLGDTYQPVPPETLPARLRAAGFVDVTTSVVEGRVQRFRARRP